MARVRHEKFINDFDCRGGFDKALYACMSAERGLSFFTDEQIELIAAEMARTERSSHTFRMRQRKQALARVARAA